MDSNFISFFDLEMVEGENFKNDSTQRNAVILSEGAPERLGFNKRSEALGVTLFSETGVPIKVAGVVREYKLRPLLRSSDHLFYEKTGVVLSYLDANNAINFPKKLVIRFHNYGAGIRNLKEIFESVFPGSAFIDYSLDTVINSQYYNYRMSRNQLVFFSSNYPADSPYGPLCYDVVKDCFENERDWCAEGVGCGTGEYHLVSA